MRSRRTATLLGTASVLALTAGSMIGLVSATAPAWADTPLAPHTTFTMDVSQADGSVPTPTDGEAIPNIDSDKATIRAYYDATGGIADKTSSRYIDQVRGIEHHILSSLPAQAPANAAVVFDVDDTLLWNYDFEDAATNFNFDPALNATYVADHRFPAVPGMPQLLAQLAQENYAIYGITGRPESQEGDTLTNLSQQGFTAAGGAPIFTADNLFTKGTVSTTDGVASIPDQSWVDCDADGTPGSCSTVEYKALTRLHVEQADGVHVVMNVGDQWSDLEGGHADAWTKIPNPTYFLASPDLTDAPASDDVMVPPTTYTMQPDGSSGYAEPSGDDIPNIDPLRKMIRAYYDAPTGTANKTSSSYISQLSSLESTWTPQLTGDCTSAAQARAAAVQHKKSVTSKVAHDKTTVAAKQRIVTTTQRQLDRAKRAKAKKRLRAQLATRKARLASARKTLTRDQATLRAITLPPTPAVVLDADDTTLWNYDLEDGVMKFVYDPATAATWVTGHLFPAVPGMVSLVQAVRGAGCTVFGLTGRPASQQADTIANLTQDGYVVAGTSTPLFTAAHFYTKDTDNQPWVHCGSDRVCSTVEYKSGTRAHIESQGYDIVGDLGDQYSDLLGGSADHVYKIPNPTYYLP